MTELRVMGMDVSVSSTGVAADDHIFTIAPGDLSEPDLLDFYYNHTLDLLREHTPHIVAIEGYSFGSKYRREPLAQVGGVVRLACRRAHVTYVTIPPMCRSKWATGKGNANKIEVVTAIASRTGMTFPNSDECDAWILRQMVLAKYQPEHRDLIPMPKAHQSAALAATQTDWPRIEIGKPELGGVLAMRRDAAARNAFSDDQSDAATDMKL